MTVFTLSQIYIYPVKSLAGIPVSRWPVTETGLQYDRKWMLVDQFGQFLSQRRLPKMALIKTALNEDELVLTAPGMASLSLPLNPVDGEVISSRIWHDQCDARTVSAEADGWLSHFLNTECRLVYQPDHEIRRVDPAYGRPGDRVSFADGFPFLIASENSLAALNQAMGLNLSMTRFRPNLVIADCASYAEDSWREISIGSIGFRLTKPCSRCAVPAIDPETAETGKEPLLTLNRLRKWNNKVYFGQNALHDQCGLLAVGDSVQIKQSGALQPPLLIAT